MLGDYFSLSIKNLKHRGIRSWLTLLGIFIGIAAVVALITLGNGLQAAVSAQFGVSSTEVITVQGGGLNAYGPPGSGVVNPLIVQDVEAIEKLSSVDLAIRRNLPSGRLEFNDRAIFGSAMSIPDGEKRELGYEIMDLEAEVGRLLKDGDRNRVMLGYNFLADTVGLEKPLKVGDKISIQGEALITRDYEVIGILKKKGSLIFDNIVYMNEGPLEDLMGYGDDVDLIAVRVKNEDVMDKAKEDIEKLLRKRRGVKVGEEDFEVSTPQAMLATVNTVLGGVQAFIIIIASLSIIVGAIGIVNTMTTSVLERRKEIGIMKAIGATNHHVFMQFMIESGLMGLIGGAVGAAIGMLIGIAGTAGIGNFIGSDIPLAINWVLILFALVGSFLVGAVAGIVPAMNAAKQNPVEALRG
jgi:putative ABC transport system permease protein